MSIAICGRVTFPGDVFSKAFVRNSVFAFSTAFQVYNNLKGGVFKLDYVC